MIRTEDKNKREIRHFDKKKKMTIIVPGVRKKNVDK